MAKTDTKIALLRGINVGGKNKIKMADLTCSLEQSGLKEVRTYIQSGNLAFSSGKACKQLQTQIHDVILADFGFDVPVLVRKQGYFDSLIANSPFCKSGKPKFDIVQLHATLLDRKPPAKAVRELEAMEFGDEFKVIKDVVYLRLVSGYSKTKLTNGFLEKKLGVPATSRNWKTICKLVEL